MKTLVVFSALASLAIAAPSFLGDNFDSETRHASDAVKREKKDLHGNHEINHEMSAASMSGLRTMVDEPNVHSHAHFIPKHVGLKKKPIIIIKKKHGHHHLYRDSEEEQAQADSQESCDKEVKVKLCDDNKVPKNSDMMMNTFASEGEMEQRIKMAKEAVESLQRDFKKMETEAKAADWKDSELESDIKMHEDIHMAREALEHIHQNFGNLKTMNLHAMTVKDAESLHNVNFQMSNAENERMTQWKEAMENIQKNAEIAKNIEDSFTSSAHEINVTVNANMNRTEPDKVTEKQNEEKTMETSASEVKEFKIEHDNKSRNNNGQLEQVMETASKSTEHTNKGHSNLVKKSNENLHTPLGKSSENTTSAPVMKMAENSKSEPMKNSQNENKMNMEKSKLMKSAESWQNNFQTSTQGFKRNANNIEEKSNVEWSSTLDFEDQLNKEKSAWKEMSLKTAESEVKTAESSINDNQHNESKLSKEPQENSTTVSPDDLEQNPEAQKKLLQTQINYMTRAADAHMMKNKQPNDLVQAHEKTISAQASDVHNRNVLDNVESAKSSSFGMKLFRDETHDSNKFMSMSTNLSPTEISAHEQQRNMNNVMQNRVPTSLRSMAHKAEELESMTDWSSLHATARGIYGQGSSGLSISESSNGASSSGSSSAAVGLFPNAKIGGCAIPLLLSCSPSVVSGHIVKSHYPSYSAPAYKAADEFDKNNKRNTRKSNEMLTTKVNNHFSNRHDNHLQFETKYNL